MSESTEGSGTPARLYHVAPVERRELIVASGLRAPHETSQPINWPGASESDGTSVYLLAGIDAARDWAEYMYMRFFRRGWDAYDVWAAAATGLELCPDPCMPPGYTSFRCPLAVAPERLLLAETVSFDELGLPLAAAASVSSRP